MLTYDTAKRISGEHEFYLYLPYSHADILVSQTRLSSPLLFRL